jgi:hypothetical protein
MSVETVIVVLGVMIYSIGRQIAGEPLRVKRLIGLPAALTVIGIVDVASNKGPGPTVTDVVLIGVGCAINVVIGICHGRLMRLGSRDGYLWGQMPASVLWWWGAKIASGVVLDGIGHVLGAGLAITSAVMLLRLGVNRLAQAAVVALRAFATGIAFAPESDNRGAGRNEGFLPETNGLLTEIRDRTMAVIDDRRGSSMNRPRSRRRGGSRAEHDRADRETGTRSSDRSSTPRPSSPPSFKRQLAQLQARSRDRQPHWRGLEVTARHRIHKEGS